ncbi:MULTISPECIES: hypothetical protein [Listeria]|uniref:hypothetical protein n=2 Tax=Listeria TaxID=1637 RepID=UPI000B58C009|nr:MULTISPECIES: hypothetical protein [Listeria]
MPFWKNKRNLALIFGGLAILFSFYIEVVSAKNVFSGNYSADLKVPIMLMFIASIIFFASFVVGYSFLWQKKYKIAIPILFVSGVPAFIFLHIFSGMFMIICGVLAKSVSDNLPKESGHS